MERIITKKRGSKFPRARFHFSCACLFIFCFNVQFVNAQDNPDLPSNNNTDKYLKAINDKSENFNKDVDKYTQKALSKMLRQEQQMQSIVMKKDSLLAKNLFGYAIDSIQKLKNIISDKVGNIDNLLRRSRIPYIDSLKKSLLFFEKNGDAIKSVSNVTSKISDVRSQLSETESKLAAVNNIQQFIQDRKSVLINELKTFPQLENKIQQFKKDAFYYRAQIAYYKEIFASPDKIEKLVMAKLQNLPAFQKLTNRLLGPFASLLGVVKNSSSDGYAINDSSKKIIGGIPTRYSVQKYINSYAPAVEVSFDPIQKIQQQAISSATGTAFMPDQLIGIFTTITDKKPDLPVENDGNITANSQRVKSFWKRLEHTADLQFGQAVNYLPATTNLTLKLGYRINDKKSAGVAVEYIMGMGTGWKHITFSHQGIGIKSYLKWNWKKGFALQGEAGWVYMLQFKNIEELRNNKAWQITDLIGISKDYMITKRVKGSIQFMIDIFYKTHIPYTQPALLRFGYAF